MVKDFHLRKLKMILNNFSKFSKKIAVISDSKKKYTYQDLLNKIEIHSRLFKKKSVVLIICENNEATLFSYLSIFKKNFLGILIPSNLDLEFINKIVKNFNPNYIVINQNINFSNKKYFVKKKINQTEVWENKIFNNIKFNSKLAVLIPTSGSTGSSKFVGLSYENIFVNFQQIKKSLNLKFSDRSITILPLSYSYGLSVINSHLFNGSSIYLYSGSILEKNFWEIINNFKITNFNLVPFTAEVLIKLKFNKLNNHHLKFITLAGGSLELSKKKELLDLCEKNKLVLFSMYGQTEASPRMSCFLVNNNKKKIQSVGRAVAGGKFTIKKSKNLISSSGEVVFEGKNIFCGYFTKTKDLNLNFKYNKKLYTGDIGYLDKDGYLYITSRKKRIAKIFGLRIDLTDLENHIKKKFNIENGCVSDDKVIKIYINSSNKIEKVKKFVNKKFKISFNHIEIKYIKFFPKNAKMQIDYNKLNNNEN